MHEIIQLLKDQIGQSKLLGYEYVLLTADEAQRILNALRPEEEVIQDVVEIIEKDLEL